MCVCVYDVIGIMHFSFISNCREERQQSCIVSESHQRDWNHNTQKTDLKRWVCEIYLSSWTSETDQIIYLCNIYSYIGPETIHESEVTLFWYVHNGSNIECMEQDIKHKELF